MSILQYDNYYGEITLGGESFFFEPADLQDVGQMAQIYAETGINEDNYKERFKMSSDNNFANLGGMFAVHDSDSILKQMKSGKSFYATIKTVEGKIAAFIWMSLEDPCFSNVDMSMLSSLSGTQHRVLSEGLQKGRIVYPRDILIAPEYRRHGLSGIMCYTAFVTAKKAGYTHSLGEVYCVHSYSESGESTSNQSDVVIDLLNNRGFKAITSMGGQFVGRFPYRNLKIGSVTVTIQSQVFVLDYSVILPVLEKNFKKNSITIHWRHEQYDERKTRNLAGELTPKQKW